nr:GDSL-type esterase/lipase family protein [Streptomyces cacaoi]
MIEQDVRMRFLLVGDSMTIGAAGDFTWRYRLWQHLTRTLTPPAPSTAAQQPTGAEPTDGQRASPRSTGPRFVGPRTALHEGSHVYADPDFPPHARAHLAGWGEGWLHMAPLVGEAVGRYAPDVLLVALGLIDLGFYTDPEQTLENVERFLDGVVEARPGTAAVLLPVVPNVRAAHDAAFAEACARFNTLLEKTVAERSGPRSPLLCASPPPDWTLTRDTYDGTHPSPEGEHRIAAAFAQALHQGWGVGGRYARDGGRPRAGEDSAPTARRGGQRPGNAASAPPGSSEPGNGALAIPPTNAL